ncbi:MAG TPA: hypothetical protein VKY86_00985 [Promicromonospora sp.]|nr:hypothetical protein [Promicromonospora sp.]
MSDTIDHARQALAVAWGLPPSAVRLTDPVDLGGSQRSRVLRCRVEAPGAPASVVVKEFVSDAEAFLREAAGLELLDRTPDLLAQDPERLLLVMTDLGDLPTLADLLLGDDPDAAWRGAADWARALGRAAGASRAQVADARDRFAAAQGWDAAQDLRRGLDRLPRLATSRPAVDAEIAAALHLRIPGAAAVLSPTDTCPDNAVLGPDGWRFLDLEGTDVVHAAAAASYALLPFSTCWCVFGPPPGLTDELLAEFTAGLAEHAPDVVEGPGWPRAVRQACALYVVLVTGWLWASAEEGRPSVGPEGRSPSYRQLLVARWRWGALALRDDLPALAAALGEAAAWALDEWGPEIETTGYRAFS